MTQYTFRPYDVLRVTYDGGVKWEDYTTLRTIQEGQYAARLVREHHTGMIRYHINRGDTIVFGE